MAEITEYSVHHPNRVHIVCPCDKLDIGFPHDISANHVLTKGTCKRSGASLDGTRMRLEMNDASTGEFARKYWIEMRIEMNRKGSETPYYLALGECPYDSCDGEVSLSRVEAYGQCKECGGAIAGVDWRVGGDCIPESMHTFPIK
jgi:hypothetical protein